MMEKQQRKSHTSTGKIYFWTGTIDHWYYLLGDALNKETILDSLRTLSGKKLITMYAFVIMPNHIHLIWKLNNKNGK